MSDHLLSAIDDLWNRSVDKYVAYLQGINAIDFCNKEHM